MARYRIDRCPDHPDAPVQMTDTVHISWALPPGLPDHVDPWDRQAVEAWAKDNGHDYREMLDTDGAALCSTCTQELTISEHAHDGQHQWGPAQPNIYTYTMERRCQHDGCTATKAGAA